MGKLIKWGLREVSGGGKWLQKPILATTWVALFFLFSEKTHPWNFGTCFGDFEFKNDEHPDYLLYFWLQKPILATTRVAFFFVFRKNTSLDLLDVFWLF